MGEGILINLTGNIFDLLALRVIVDGAFIYSRRIFILLIAAFRIIIFWISFPFRLWNKDRRAPLYFTVLGISSTGKSYYLQIVVRWRRLYIFRTRRARTNKRFEECARLRKKGQFSGFYCRLTRCCLTVVRFALVFAILFEQRSFFSNQNLPDAKHKYIEWLPSNERDSTNHLTLVIIFNLRKRTQRRFYPFPPPPSRK